MQRANSAQNRPTKDCQLPDNEGIQWNANDFIVTPLLLQIGVHYNMPFYTHCISSEVACLMMFN